MNMDKWQQTDAKFLLSFKSKRKREINIEVILLHMKKMYFYKIKDEHAWNTYNIKTITSY